MKRKTMKSVKKDNSIPYSNKNKFGLEPTELNYKYHTMNKMFLKPGQFTDDTSMALCLADSLIYSSSKFLQTHSSMDFENESLKIQEKAILESARTWSGASIPYITP